MIDWQPRRATAADADELVRLRRLMFEAMGESVADPAWEETCRTAFRDRLAGRSLVAIVVDAPQASSVLAASGIISLEEVLPGPALPSGRMAYLSSMSTDPRWRRQGMAAAVLERCLDEVSALDVARVELHATDVAEAMYRRVGFVDRPGGRQLRLASRRVPDC